MDNNKSNRLSNAARKRRSSILKSHRPPRTPFSELEFNDVATSGDTKSRRVSFSRHKDVAEFITHEATGTWRNIYTEHNKSDSLGNDSDTPPKATAVLVTQNVRIYEQFDEVECIDTFGNPKSCNAFNELNCTDQLPNFSNIDVEVRAPNHNFELSFLTENQSVKLDILNPIIGETTGGINVDFSAIQPIGPMGDDDLDQITNDLDKSNGCNMLGGAFRKPNMSEYIVDSDLTQKPNDYSDMSITDTIPSPKVQVVAQSTYKEIRKSSNLSKDWMTDKENMVVNPYIEPADEDDPAVNTKPEKVLVFNGRNLKYASIDADLDDLEDPIVKHPHTKGSMSNLLAVEPANYELPSTSRNIDNFVFEGPSTSANDSIMAKQNPTLEQCDNDISLTQCLVNNDINQQELITNICAPKLTIPEKPHIANISLGKTNSRKTMVLNVNDDLPNLVSDFTLPYQYEDESLRSNTGLSKSIFEGDMTLTKGVIPIEFQPRRTTILFNNDALADISMTQALSSVISSQPERTVFDSSIDLGVRRTDIPEVRRQTIHFDDGNLSMTPAVPIKIDDVKAIFNKQEKLQTIVNDDDQGNLSMTQAIPSNIGIVRDGTNKRETIVFEDGDISMTQAVPIKIDDANGLINIQEKRQTNVFNDEKGDLSMTQAIPSNIGIDHGGTKKRQTIVYEDDNCDLSITKAVPIKIYDVKALINKQEKRQTIVYDDEKGDLSITQGIPSNIGIVQDGTKKRQTIVFEGDNCDLSMTQAVPIKIDDVKTLINKQEKRQTIVYGDDKGDLSMTQAISSNIGIVQGGTKKRQTIVFEDDNCDLSMTQAVPIKIDDVKALISKQDKQQTIVYDDDKGDLSMTQAIPSNIGIVQGGTKKRQTIVFEGNNCDLSMTQAVPIKIDDVKALINKKEKRQTIVYDDDKGDLSMTEAISSNIGIVHGGTKKRQTIVFEGDNCDLSITQAVPIKIDDVKALINKQEKQQTIVYDDDKVDLSMTQAIPSNIGVVQGGTKKRQTIVLEGDNCDLSMTQAVPINIDDVKTLINKQEKRQSIVIDTNKGELSMTEAISSNIGEVQGGTKKRQTIVFEDDNCDLSMTQAVSIKIDDVKGLIINQEKRQTIVYDSDKGDLPMTQAIPSNIGIVQGGTKKRQTIVFEDDNCDLSLTQAVPIKIDDVKGLISKQEKRQTIVFDDDKDDLSMTQSIPSNIGIVQGGTNKRHAIVFDDYNADLSVTQAFPIKIDDENKQEKRKTIVYDDDDKGDLSMTQANSSNIGIVQSSTMKRQTIVFENNNGDLSMTQAVPIKILNDVKEKLQTIVFDEDKGGLSMSQTIPSKTFTTQNGANKRKSVLFDDDKADLSKTAISSNVGFGHAIKRKTIRCGEDDSSISSNIITEDRLSNITIFNDKKKTMESKTNRDTIVFDSDIGHIAMTEELPANIEVENGFSKFKTQTFQPDILFTQIATDTKLSTKQGILEFDKSIENISLTEEINFVDISMDDISETKLKHTNLAKEEVVVYQSITASNKTITQSIRKVNEAKTSMVTKPDDNDLETKADDYSSVLIASKLSVVNKSICELKANILSKETPIDLLQSENPIHVIFSGKDNDISSCSEPDIAVTKAINTFTNNLTYNEMKVVEKNLRDVKSNVQPKKSLINKILNMSDASMEIDSHIEVSNATQTVDETKSSDNFIPIINDDEDTKSVTIEANQENELEAVNNKILERVNVLTKPDFKNSSPILQKQNKEKKSPLKDKLKSVLGKVKETKTNNSQMHEINVAKTAKKSLKDLNNTKHLMEAITDHIDKKIPNINDIDAKKHENIIQNSRKSLGFEYKSQPSSGRQSIVLNREELLSNISMAQAVLQKSCMDIDNTIEDTPVPSEKPQQSKHMIRVSNDVVKTLHFKDDSMEKDISPLKKSTVIESTKETNKSYVIPSHLKDVTDDLKELMGDLVKPMVDVPHVTKECKSEKKSTKVQANLHSSSQIDTKIEKIKSPHKIPKRISIMPEVLTFDVKNPLNNISIPSIDKSNAHKYNPIGKDEKIIEDIVETVVKTDKNIIQISRVEAKRDFIVKNAETNDKHLKTKEIEVNTVIAMKSNNTLIAERSSLTIVDEDVQINSEKGEITRKRNYSPNKVAEQDKTPKPLKKLQRKSTSPKTKDNANAITKQLISQCYATTDDDLHISEVPTVPKSNSNSTNSNKQVNNDQLIIKKEILKEECFSIQQEEFKIDDIITDLPFMGTKLCQWESNTNERWSFLLLHSRIRVVFTFGTDNNRYVARDTKIYNISVDIVKNDENSIANQTSKMAHTIFKLHLASLNPGLAGDMPEIIQRLTTVSWQARRWGQFMESTRIRLAFTIIDDVITLKVANVPLRSVWEVSLKIAVKSFPTASDVSVSNCLSQHNIDQSEIRKLVGKIPKDWGHVPNSLWKVFDYLRNKTKTEFLGLKI